MKFVKYVAIILAVYIALVALFESLLGYFQPANEDTITITTINDAGQPANRVLSRIKIEDTLYVAANHWPRDWYHNALDRPGVEVTTVEGTGSYHAVPMTGADHDEVDAARPLPLVFRILTGFPPRYFLRLDPVSEDV